MRRVDFHEAKTHLSRPVDAAANGESFLITRAGKPMVEVVAVDRIAARRRIGFMEGEFDIPDDFDRSLEDEIARLYGDYSGPTGGFRP